MQLQTQQNSNQTLQIKESLTVVLRPDHRGFGLALKLAEDHMNYIVSLLEAGGPAERSGILLPGDKVIAINRRMLRDLQPSEVINILETSQMVSANSSSFLKKFLSNKSQNILLLIIFVCLT